MSAGCQNSIEVGRTRSIKGFSLIELMVVVSIISVISTLAIPKVIFLNIRAAQAEGHLNMKAFYTLGTAWCDESHPTNCIINGSAGLYAYGVQNTVAVCGSNPIGFSTTNCETGRYVYNSHESSAGFAVTATSKYYGFKNGTVNYSGNYRGPPTRMCKSPYSTMDVYYFDGWYLNEGIMTPFANDPQKNAMNNCF